MSKNTTEKKPRAKKPGKTRATAPSGEQSPGTPEGQEGGLQVEHKPNLKSNGSEIAVFKPLVESKEDPRALFEKRVTLKKGGLSAEIDKDTPLTEFMPMYGYLSAINEHSSFLLGDMAVFAEKTYGPVWQEHMLRSGRAVSTINANKQIADSFPPKLRKDGLTATHCRAMLHVEDEEKKKELITIAIHGQDGTSQEPLTKREFNAVVKKVAPKAKKTSGKGSGKAGRPKKGTKQPKGWEPYSPSFEQQSEIDGLRDKLNVVTDAINENFQGQSMEEVVTSLGDSWKKPILAAGKAIVEFLAAVERTVGWGS